MGKGRQLVKTIKRNAGYYAFVSLRATIAALPAGAGMWVGECLGRNIYRFVGRERRRAIDSLSKAFGSEKPREELERIARECFVNMGRLVGELCRLWNAGPEKILELYEGDQAKETMTEVMSQGRGVVGVTAHLDNWELLGAWAAASGFPLTVVARRIYFEKYDRLIVGLRKRFGLNVVYQDESPRKLLRALKNGHLLAVLADQDIRRLDGVFVPFLGRPAFTPTGPVSLALAARCPMMLIHTQRFDRFKHRVFASEPLEFDRSDKQKALLEGTIAWTALLEESIRSCPEQWVWMHRRWRTKLTDRPEIARKSGFDMGPDKADQKEKS